jgi:outer membrane protein OmpA-like peptidoglycan-associated protein/Tol biopolymer transport system component
MRFIYKILFIALLAAVALPVTAQIRRGDRYFNKGDYARAIPAYEKGLRKKNDVRAMENLANAYRITKNYVKAEEWYAKTVAANPNCHPMVHFYYGMVLKNNGKVPEARAELMKFMNQEPQNALAKEQVEALDNIQVWLTQTPNYAVHHVEGLNSDGSDISPAIFDSGILFVSDRGAVDLLNGENAGTGRGFYSIYYSSKKREFEDSITFANPKKLSKTINKEFHNGPVSVTADGKQMAFNRVYNKLKLQGKNFVNRPQIFFADKKGSSWKNIRPFQYNSEEYSCAHPALSADGNTLYFASDMKGTLGGSDIWYCKKEGDGWSQPVNMGPMINTPGNEVFPYLRNDGVLFFSSDGHGGLGGLDIFSTEQDNNVWGEAVNQGVPLNGPTDDFSVTFNEDASRGYFTSDRAGGLGSDDVYSFKVTSKFVNIRGTLLAGKSTSEIMPNTKVELLTKDGKLLKTSTTDAQGNFKFDNLPSDQNYIVRLNEDDPSLQGKPKYYMADDKNQLVRVTVMDEVGGKFTFQNMPVDPNAPPQLLADDEYLTIAGNLISDGNPPTAIANTKVDLKDEQGNIVQSTTTNEFGAFAFTRVPPDKSYIVAMAEGEDPKLSPNSTVSITSKNGKQVMTTHPDASGKFEFRILSTDQNTISLMSVEEPELRLDMRGVLTGADSAHTILPNTKVNMLNEQGEVVQSVTTDEKGYFNFVNIPADQAYIMSVENIADPGLAALGKLYVRDDNGKVLKTLRMGSDGKFEFRVLPIDLTTLGYVYVEDPWLRVLQMRAKQQNDSLLIIENIYYEYGSADILPSAELTLAKVVKVMQLDPSITIEISSHTDSRAANDYNQRLSQKRAQNVVDYLVKRGIDKKRLKAVGYGESHLLNKCSDGINCSEDEHAKNRRTEFKINKK